MTSMSTAVHSCSGHLVSWGLPNSLHGLPALDVCIVFEFQAEARIQTPVSPRHLKLKCRSLLHCKGWNRTGRGHCRSPRRRPTVTWVCSCKD